MCFMSKQPERAELSLSEAFDFLEIAQESLDLCIEYSSSRKEFAISSMLFHVSCCIREALKSSKDIPSKEKEFQKILQSARKL